MLFEALRDSVRYPVVWIAAVVYAALDVVQLVLSLQGETFFSVRFMVIEYLLLPFLLAGAYGVLRDRDSSFHLFGTEAVKNFFRVLLPGLVLAFLAIIVLFLLVLPLSILGIDLTVDLVTGATLAIMIPVLFFSFLYDTAACFEGLGVFASLRRSFALVLAHIWQVVVFILTILAVLLGLAFVLLDYAPVRAALPARVAPGERARRLWAKPARRDDRNNGARAQCALLRALYRALLRHCHNRQGAALPGDRRRDAARSGGRLRREGPVLPVLNKKSDEYCPKSQFLPPYSR